VARTILVVDDQDVVRDVIRIALEDAGYRVLEASTPSKALSITQRDAAIDLLLADVVMPEMDAFELADRIAEDVPGIRVLYTSGYTDAREEGPFIRKPFTPTELVAKVEAVLASE
jgi:two-component system cell cycle sensor histidine kinase/response regulator CckA